MNILITGGSSGLGRKIVETLASKGLYTIYFTYNTGEISAKMLEDNYENVFSIKVDFCNENDVCCLKGDIPVMDLDILVNNAYVGSIEPVHFHKTNVLDFLDSFKNNILPTIQITQEAIISFKKKRFGKIVNILTDYISNPPIGYSVYVSNKAYLLELSKVWNKEYVRYNITSNCISPSYMRTNFSQFDERFVEQMEQQHPLKKILTTEETARIVEFLIEAPQQLNGVNLPINGGRI